MIGIIAEPATATQADGRGKVFSSLHVKFLGKLHCYPAAMGLLPRFSIVLGFPRSCPSRISVYTKGIRLDHGRAP